MYHPETFNLGQGLSCNPSTLHNGHNQGEPAPTMALSTTPQSDYVASQTYMLAQIHRILLELHPDFGA
jgi:hypothetical protein